MAFGIIHLWIYVFLLLLFLSFLSLFWFDSPNIYMRVNILWKYSESIIKWGTSVFFWQIDDKSSSVCERKCMALLMDTEHRAGWLWHARNLNDTWFTEFMLRQFLMWFSALWATGFIRINTFYHIIYGKKHVPIKREQCPKNEIANRLTYCCW